MKTVLLTGVTGFIAKRVALEFLEAGYAVRGSLRSPDRAEEVRAALRPRTVALSILVTIEMANALNALSQNESLLTFPYARRASNPQPPAQA